MTGPDINDNVVPYTVFIPQGLYSIGQLEQAIQLQLESALAKVLPFPLVNLYPDSATGRVILRLNYPNSSVTFNPGSLYELMGFNVGDVVTNTISLAPNVASFNPVDSFLIHSSLCDQGLPVNNMYSQIVGQVQIDVAPGSQIVTESINPAVVSADKLIGRTERVEMWLTDSRNRPVNTNGETWSARLVITY